MVMTSNHALETIGVLLNITGLVCSTARSNLKPNTVGQLVLIRLYLQVSIPSVFNTIDTGWKPAKDGLHFLSITA